jgi:hypothetical protein
MGDRIASDTTAMPFRSLVLFLLALAVVGSAVFLWRRPRPQVEEREPAPSVTPEPPHVEPLPVTASPPAPAEVQPALDRVFAGAVAMDAAVQPWFVAGDLNGDDVPDLAVAVRPRAEGLAKLNAGLQSWRTLDAQAASPGPPARPAPLEIARSELLLAVIHGAEGGAWRAPGTTQGYLVKNALGSGLRLQPLSAVPDEIRERVIRVHKGDVIAQVRAGRPGVVFWTGAAYAWADLPR